MGFQEALARSLVQRSGWMLLWIVHEAPPVRMREAKVLAAALWDSSALEG